MKTTIAASLALAATLSATALASADAAPSTHPAEHARAGAYRVSATVNKTELLLNSVVKIRAKVFPAAPGAEVTLQVKYEDRKSWKTIDRGRLSNAGKVIFKDKVGSVRERRYRVVKPADAGHGAGQGTAPRVTVFGWRDLTSLSPATFNTMSEVDTSNINGVAYPQSLRAYLNYHSPSSALTDYNLNRDCKAFRGVVGLDDTSPEAATATIRLSTDGIQRYSGSFALTQAAPVTFDVTQVFRLSLSATSNGSAVAAVGHPQVLCSF